MLCLAGAFFLSGLYLWKNTFHLPQLFILLGLLTLLSYAFTTHLNRELASRMEDSIQEALKINNELVEEIVSRKKAEDRFRLAAATVSDLIYEWNMYDDTLLWYGDIGRVLGFESGEFPHTLEAWVNRIHPDDVARMSDAIDHHRNSTEEINYEYQIQRKDGNWRYWSDCAVPVLDKDGKPVKWIGNCVDVTERKQNEQKLIENDRKINRLKRMECLGLLAGGVAHDLNNILSGLVSLPELMLMGDDLNPKQKKSIEVIKESGEKAAMIVKDLLTVARGVATTKKTLNINDRISTYLHSSKYRKLVHYHPDVTIKTVLDPDLLVIKGSSIHIEKIVMNLVSNAAEAIEGSGNIILSTKNIYLDRPLKGYDNVNIGEYVVFCVEDDGPGIAEEDLERIFEPFYSKKVLGRSGTGLGMTVVWNTVQDHNGYLYIATSETGTAITVYFPITRGNKVEEVIEHSLEAFQGAGQAILVVDDEKTQRIIASEMAISLGYNVKAVASGEEAIDYLRENTVDLILLDMIMDPGINGCETYEQIIKIHPHQKAILASGYSVTKEVTKALRLGVAQYIQKPYSIQQIAKAMSDELNK